MYIPITTAALVLLTVAMLLLRIFWNRVPPRVRFVLIRMSIALVILQAFSAATKWGTTSGLLNVLINWLAIAGYELLVLLFSRLSPKWLTSISAAILLVPIFASSVLIPLTELFDHTPHRQLALASNLFYEIKPWKNVGNGNAGVDLLVCYRPPFAPFLRHKIQTIPFNNRECNANAAVAIFFPEPKAVLGRCPRWPSGSTGTVDKLFQIP